jgi:hypothetical protein
MPEGHARSLPGHDLLDDLVVSTPVTPEERAQDNALEEEVLRQHRQDGHLLAGVLADLGSNNPTKREDARRRLESYIGPDRHVI